MLATLVTEVRIVLRRLWVNRGYSGMALLSLTLGIGACVAMVAVVDGVLLQPLPYPQPDRLLQVQETADQGHGMPLAGPNLDDLRQRHQGLAALAEYSGGVTSVSSGTHALRTGAYFVGRDFLQVLQIQPMLGGGFSVAAGNAGGALVSERYWRETLGAPSTLDGATVRAFGFVLPVAGVMPAGFEFPEDAQVWIDAAVLPTYNSRSAHNWEVVARLDDGVSLNQAQVDASAIGQSLQAEYGDEVDLVGFTLTDLRTAMVGSVSTALWMLMAGVGCLLLIAATTVSNLSLAQALGRRQELAVRVALGAGAAQINRQFVLESLLLGVIGLFLGCVVAQLALTLLVDLAVDNLPRGHNVYLSGRVLSIALLGTLLVSTLIGLLAAHSSRASIASSLKDGGRSSSAGRHTSRLRQTLVVGQGALTVVLLVAAGLLARSFVSLLQQDPGFRPEGALALSMTLSEPAGAEGDARVVTRLDALIQALSTIPGVVVIGGSDGLPLSGDGSNGSFFDPSADLTGTPEPLGYAEYRAASAGYIDAVGMSLLRGRDFQPTDRADAPHVALISRSLAESTWPGQDPIGQRLQFGNMDGDLRVLNVIGVVADVHERALDKPVRGTVYVNYAQRPAKARDFSLVLRSAGDLSSLSGTLQRRLPQLAPDLPVQFRSLSSVYRDSLAKQRFSLNLFSLFGVVALALAASGLYGLMAFLVSQRSSEIAVRLALGSTPQRVQALVMRQGLSLQLSALGLGLLAALALSRWMSSQLFGVQSNDPLTMVAVSALLIGVTVLACWLPARRAAGVPPQAVLH